MSKKKTDIILVALRVIIKFALLKQDYLFSVSVKIYFIFQKMKE